MAQRVVIAGGSGFLGLNLSRRLVADNWDVVCLDNLSTGRHGSFDDDLPVSFVHADVTEPFTVSGPVDLVLHLASPASPTAYTRLPVETLLAGSVGTRNALELARVKGARLIFASSSEVYGDPHVHPQPEEYWGNVNPVGPRSVYDEAKRFGEALVMAYHREGLADVGIARIFNTYGPGMRWNDGRAIPAFVSSALAGAPIRVAGDGLQTRSFCYVDDLVDGLVRLAGTDHVGPVNLGNPHEYTILQVAELVRDLVNPCSPIEFVPLPVDDPCQRKPDVTLASKLLDWSPSTVLADGLPPTIRSIEADIQSHQNHRA